jgi:hypothetical protein
MSAWGGWGNSVTLGSLVGLPKDPLGGSKGYSPTRRGVLNVSWEANTRIRGVKV